MKKISIAFILSLVVLLGAESCSKLEPTLPKNADLLDGSVDGLSSSENQQFLSGDKAFNDLVFTPETGLGPLFVATSCGSCHTGDGKGHPFTELTRFGQSDSNGNSFLAQGGPQLQHRAIPGYTPENLPTGATFSKLIAPVITGLGFLESVSDADILAMADPNDANSDGISGVPNWVSLPSYISPSAGAITQNGKYIHRFGKKASSYNLFHQTVKAYSQDIGITSLYEPHDTYSGLESDPEVSSQIIQNVVFYLHTLKAPVQRNIDDADVIQGKQIFVNIGCVSCHKESLTTSYSPIAAISNKVFHPYTDLLLHDMGESLNDGYTEGGALSYEWRTAPLWGLGLAKNSQGGELFLLHDGRAKSIEGALNYHGGEAVVARTNFFNLSDTDRKKLVKFLESL